MPIPVLGVVADYRGYKLNHNLFVDSATAAEGFDINALTVKADPDEATDFLPIYSVADGENRKITIGSIDHDQLFNWVANKHIDHSTVSIIAGTGLTGGGDITATRTLNVDPGSIVGVDHGLLSGLGDDDHLQYALLAGRSGGQTLIGGVDSGDDLTLRATSHATPGSIILHAASAPVGTALFNDNVLSLSTSNAIERLLYPDFASELATYINLEDLSNVVASFPSSTGSLLYADSITTWNTLPIGTNGTFLGVSGGVPQWRSTSTISHPTLSDLGWASAGHFIDTNFLPQADASVALGSASKRWTSLFITGNLSDGTNTVTVANIVSKTILTVDGDIFIRSGGTVARLGIGTAGQVLTVSGGLPSWQTASPGYTDEQAQDAVGGILTDSSSIDFTYNDAGNTISAVVLPAGVDHGSLGGLGDDDHPQYAALAQDESITGNWTFANNVVIDGVADEIQLRVQGNATQTTNIFEVENSAAINLLTVSNAGLVTGIKFAVNETTLGASKDNYLTQFNINATAGDIGTVYRGMFYDLDYVQNAAGGAHLSTVRGIDLDIDVTNTATAFSGMTVQFMKGTLDTAAAVGNADRVFDLQATINSTSYGGGTQGAYLMQITGATSNSLIALKTDARNSGSGRIIGYQGAGTALTGATGEVVGVEGFITSVSGVARVIAMSALPRGGGGVLPTSDKILSFKGASGHILVGSGSVAILTSTPADLSTVSTTHLNFASNSGELYVQGAVEFDAKAWFDNDVEMADTRNIIVATGTGTKIATATTQKLGFWNVTPVVQYATTGTLTGFTANTTTPVLDGSTFTGNTGATAYTIGDIVRALKLCGVMAA